MKSLLVLATFSILGSSFSVAQNVSEERQSDPVLDAIQEFNKRDREKPNEVTVVLDPVGQPPAEILANPEAGKTTATKNAETAAEAVLVAGKPSEKTDVAAAHEISGAAITPGESTPLPENGLSVRVEKIQGAGNNIDPAQVKLRAPFPAKPLAPAPPGWHLDASDSAPPFTREVEIAPGTKITLSIRPHLLVPDADGAHIFTVSEPGYDHSLGYQQTATVGAILSNSIRQLDDDSKRLGNAIESLQQLLVSLPKPAEPEEKPAIITPPSRKR